MNRNSRRVALGTGVLAALLGLGGLLGAAQRGSDNQEPGANLSRSIGSDCTVHLVLDHSRDMSGTVTNGGVTRRDDTLYRLEGVLTASSDAAITIQVGKRVYWVPVSRIHAVEFERR